ncbi:hypothetical protein [Phenylobacterium sp.]|uniref:hypothetical protein n=1 Tax=Phenylobacterium sp. TaxID=1871053 RepID=UPI0037C79360
MKNRWAVEVELSGISLEAAVALVASVESDEVDSAICITSVAWDAVDDPQVVHRSAEQVLDLIRIGNSVRSNSSAGFGWKGRLWEQASPGVVRTHYRMIAGTGDFFLDPDRATNTGARPFGDRVETLLTKHPRIEPALQLFATCGSDVRAMWLAFEVVKQLAGGEKELVNLCWTTQEDLDQFMTTANTSFRHFDLGSKRKNLPEPLHPNGCRAYVRMLLERLLDAEVPV